MPDYMIYIVGVRFIEPLDIGLDKPACQMAGRSSPYKNPEILRRCQDI